MKLRNALDSTRRRRGGRVAEDVASRRHGAPWLGRSAATLAAAVLLLACSGVAAAERTPGPLPEPSSADFTSPQAQALQRDDGANPGMLWVAEGAALWSQPVAGAGDASNGAANGTAATSCASCHGDAAVSMRGVAARYPRFDARLQRPLALRDRIAACRTGRQHAATFAADGEPLLALETFVTHQSRGLPLAPGADPRLAPWRERGERLYRQRIGQLDLSCAQCHDERAGQRLGGALIPQGQPTGYPVYRLEWQAVGNLLRRLRNCMTGVRAEPFAAGAPQWVELELYLNARAAGLPIETPGVRP